AAGAHLDLGVAAGHTGVKAALRHLDGRRFAARVEELLAVYPAEHAAALLNLLDSHDTPRALALCGEDEPSLRIATLLQMAMPGAPSIYYGDEIGITGRADPDCRRSFPPDESDWNLDLLEFMRAAVGARAADPALRGDGHRTLGAAGSVVAFERSSGTHRSVVAANAGETPAELVLPAPLEAGHLSQSLSSDLRAADLAPAGDGGVAVTLPARWAGIWRVVP
ncbi:MAG: alpha-amylase family glycosyl hydrolase, partial [Candidatus Limnocylindria bacterium]